MSFVLGSPVIQGAMKHYGASHAIVYGVIPAAAPLIIVGTTVLGIAASKADWPQFGAALTVVIGGVGRRVRGTQRRLAGSRDRPVRRRARLRRSDRQAPASRVRRHRWAWTHSTR